MRKLTVALAFIFSIFLTQAQNADYLQAMKETAAKWEGIQGPEDMQALANTYERISQVASDEWLPRYYASYMYVIKAFNVEKKKDDFLDKAQEHLDAALSLGGDKSEIAALQGFLYIGRITVNTMVRGMTYSGKVEKACKEAIALNESNPRGHYVLGMYYQGMPKFIGGGMEAACPYFQAAQKHNEAFEPASPIHPTWDSGRIARLAGECNSQ